MLKDVAISVLIALVIVESGALLAERTAQRPIPAAGGQAQSAKPAALARGMKLADSSLAQYAHKIVPEDTSGSSQYVPVGFAVTTKKNADGTTKVNLTPKDSDDQSQEYTLKSGEMLYFMEMTTGDDKADSDRDLNYRDDYGIITDSDGIVQ